MTTLIVHALARCEGCDKSYRVPDAERTYKCKSCGGVVRSTGETDDAGEPVIPGTITCTECEAINPSGLHYCIECGSILELSQPVEGGDVAARLRHEGADALKSAYTLINSVALMYRLGACTYALATLFAIIALARLDTPLGAGILVVVLTSMLSVLLLMAALHIQFKPFLWTMAVAVLATVVSVVHIVGPNPYGLAVVGSAAWALLGWAALVPTLRFSRLIASHKDLYILHHASARTRRALQGRTAHQRHERLLLAMRKAARRTWKISAAGAAGLCLASIVGTVTVVKAARPADFSPTLVTFETAWNASDLSAINELFSPSSRDIQSERLEGFLRGHGWLTNPPQLESGRMLQDGKRVSIDYEFDVHAISADWSQAGTYWTLVQLDLPAPPVQPTFDRFLEAWRTSDPEAIAGFFNADAQAEMLTSIKAAARARHWRVYPKILSTDIGDHRSGDASAAISVADGKITTDWHLWPDGLWRMYGLRFPRR